MCLFVFVHPFSTNTNMKKNLYLFSSRETRTRKWERSITSKSVASFSKILLSKSTASTSSQLLGLQFNDDRETPSSISKAETKIENMTMKQAEFLSFDLRNCSFFTPLLLTTTLLLLFFSSSPMEFTSTLISKKPFISVVNAISPEENIKEKTLISYNDKIYPQVHLEKIPSNWIQTETEVGSNINDRRRLIVFKDPNSEASVFIAYTPIRPDYPALSAFGNIDAVTDVVIPDGPGVKSEIIYRKERKDKYEFEYIFQPSGQEARHLFTTWSMIPGDVLVTYTGQCLEKNYQDSTDLKSTLRKISDSFLVDNNKK